METVNFVTKAASEPQRKEWIWPKSLKSAAQTCVEVSEVLRCAAKGAMGALWILRARAKSDVREECVRSYENHHGDLARIENHLAENCFCKMP